MYKKQPDVERSGVYATNHPHLTLPAVVLAYRQQYVIERGFGQIVLD